MKVLQIVQKPQRRGAEIFAFQLGRELRRQGHESRTVYLYSFNGASPLPLDTNHLDLGGREGSPLERAPGFHPLLLHRLLSQIRRYKPQVVQANGGRSVKYCALAKRFSTRRFTLVYRNIGNPHDWVRGRTKRLFYRLVLVPAFDGAVAVSENTLNAVRELYGARFSGIGVNNSVAIPRGVDPGSMRVSRGREEVRREAGLPETALLVLFVGSLSPEKRLDRLLRVFRKVRSAVPESFLAIAGEGPGGGEAERQAADSGLVGCVRFLGVREDIPDLMNAADVLVLTSDTEGVPGVILEAGFMGLPVVATRVGGVEERVIEGETGKLVEPGNEKDLVSALVQLLTDRGLRQRVGARAKQHARERYTMDRTARQYIDYYRGLLS